MQTKGKEIMTFNVNIADAVEHTHEGVPADCAVMPCDTIIS